MRAEESDTGQNFRLNFGEMVASDKADIEVRIRSANSPLKFIFCGIARYGSLPIPSLRSSHANRPSAGKLRIRSVVMGPAATTPLGRSRVAVGAAYLRSLDSLFMGLTWGEGPTR